MQNLSLDEFNAILVSELLSEVHFNFYVPSFQRGYRWEEKEVIELLEDIWNFVSTSTSSVYFLQPIVVRPFTKVELDVTGKEVTIKYWEVLDGQQRLTTMLLVLNSLIDYLSSAGKQVYKNLFFRIKYETRPDMDFDHPNKNANLDSHHVYYAKETIEKWITKKVSEKQITRIEEMAKALFYPDYQKKVCFIWYPISNKSSTRDSIDLFNRLNKGKIRLTGSELVKALFVLSYKKNGTKDSVARFSLEWDEIVRKLQNDSFWFFISEKQDEQTRMDTLLNFVTGKENDDDAYREFQKAYDSFAMGETSVQAFDGKEYNDFPSMWRILKHGFGELTRWYEDVTAYNYVGWLVRNGKTLREIKVAWEITKSETMNAEVGRKRIYTVQDHYANLRRTIKECLKGNRTEFLSADVLASLTYSDQKELLRKILLLFNIESARVSGIRFQFDCYEKEKNGWDLEHVDSQEDNSLIKNEDRIDWIGFVLEILSWMREPHDIIAELRDVGSTLKSKLETQKSDKGNEFGNYYSRIVKFFADSDEAKETSNQAKDGICNLTLLDAGTNRSYKNAPFPYKRFYIINRDKNGEFVPECTKNLFLKYYSDSGKEPKQIDLFRWSAKDQENYFNAICKKLSLFIEEEN